MKKNFEFHFDELETMAARIAEFDEISALSFICLLIDQTARESEHTAPELAEIIEEQVLAVNNELGAY